MDLFIRSTANLIGPGGLKCPCCDMKMCHKRKSKINRNILSQLRRTKLKVMLKQEIKYL